MCARGQRNALGVEHGPAAAEPEQLRALRAGHLQREHVRERLSYRPDGRCLCSWRDPVKHAAHARADGRVCRPPAETHGCSATTRGTAACSGGTRVARDDEDGAPVLVDDGGGGSASHVFARDASTATAAVKAGYFSPERECERAPRVVRPDGPLPRRGSTPSARRERTSSRPSPPRATVRRGVLLRPVPSSRRAARPGISAPRGGCRGRRDSRDGLVSLSALPTRRGSSFAPRACRRTRRRRARSSAARAPPAPAPADRSA